MCLSLILGVMYFIAHSPKRSHLMHTFSFMLGTSDLDAHALSDRKGSVYKQFQLKTKSKAMITGSIELSKNMKHYKQYFNFSATMKETQGATGLSAAKQMPADFLIDEDGKIFDLFRSTTPQDQMPFDRLEKFIPEGKRCKCNKKDCISTICRETYEEIRKENEAMFGAGGYGNEEEDE